MGYFFHHKRTPNQICCQILKILVHFWRSVSNFKFLKGVFSKPSGKCIVAPILWKIKKFQSWIKRFRLQCWYRYWTWVSIPDTETWFLSHTYSSHKESWTVSRAYAAHRQIVPRQLWELFLLTRQVWQIRANIIHL